MGIRRFLGVVCVGNFMYLSYNSLKYRLMHILFIYLNRQTSCLGILFLKKNFLEKKKKKSK